MFRLLQLPLKVTKHTFVHTMREHTNSFQLAETHNIGSSEIKQLTDGDEIMEIIAK